MSRGAAAVTLHLAGLSRPVRLPPELVPVLAACLTGWPPQTTPTPTAPLARITRQRGCFRFVPASTAEPMGNLTGVGAICALIAELAQARCETPDIALGLHCAALEIGGRLAVLAGPARAGKTTLAVRLALEPGVRLFCDDVLPVRPDGRGMALGPAPRLRLPLPADAGAVLNRLVAAHMGPSDHRYGYVTLPDQAPHGALAPLGALVLLDRRPGPAQLGRLPDSTGLRLALAQSITRADSPGAALELAVQTVQGLPALRLSYADLDQAAALLARTLADPALLDALPRVDPPPATGPEAPPAPSDQPLERSPGTARRGLPGATYLWQPDEAELWQLNPVADAIWTLLDIPGTPAQIAATLSEAFPAVPPARIAQDTAALLGALLAAGLVRPALATEKNRAAGNENPHRTVSPMSPE